MTTPDPVDDLLSGLQTPAPPANGQPRVEQAFRNYAQESQRSSARLWRAWGRWWEPALVALFVVVFVVWAFLRVLAG